MHDEERPEGSALVPDQVEETAGKLVDSSRDATARAAGAARAAGSASTAAREQAGARITEMGTAARADDPRHWRVLTACILAAIATSIDPPILQATSSGVQGTLRLDPQAAAQLISLVYIIQAGVMVLGGVLGDLRGLRSVLLAGLIGVLGFSMTLVASGNTTQLALSHLGLSLFSAVVIPLSLASVMRTFPTRVMPVAIALYLSIQMVAVLLSPPLAQSLYERGGFAATMVPSVLFTVLAMVGGWRWLPRLATGERMRLADAFVLSLWAVGILAIVYGVTAAVAGWGTQHVTAVVAGAALLLAAVSRMSVGRTRLHLPQLPFRVLGVTLLTGAALGMIQSGILLQLSTFLKGVEGYSDLASGLAFAPFAIATLVVSLAVGVSLTRRYRRDDLDISVFRGFIVRGMLVTALSAALLSRLTPDTGYLLIGVALALLGMGASLANVPRTDLLFRSVEPDRVGTAAGLNGSSFLLGGALGNVAVTAMIAATSASAWQEQMEASGLTSDQAAALYAAAQRVVFIVTANPFEGASYLDVAQQAPGWAAIFTDAFTAALVALCLVGLLAAVAAALGLRLSRQVVEEAAS